MAEDFRLVLSYKCFTQVTENRISFFVVLTINKFLSNKPNQ